jgi:hypothetical protein
VGVSQNIINIAGRISEAAIGGAAEPFARERGWGDPNLLLLLLFNRLPPDITGGQGLKKHF